jgi:glutaredoxin
MKVELLYFEGCPHSRIADDRLTALEPELGFRLSRREVTTPEEARRLGFRGSPTILVEGVDPFVGENDPIGLACRIYQTPTGPAGCPTDEQLRNALSR